MNRLYVYRQVAAAILVICGAVALGISAHVEHSVRTLGLSTSVFTFAAFVGAWTLLAEIGMAAVRFINPQKRFNSLGAETGLALVNWIFYIAAASATTAFTEMDRSACKHLDDLFDLPEFEGVDQNTLASIKNALSAACSEIHAELAFFWIGFIVCTAVLVGLVMAGIKGRSQPNVWQTSIRNHTIHPADPFADPVGSYNGPTVGIARDVEQTDPISKP